MADENSDASPGLFGWVPAPVRGQGRPAYEWTREKSNKIIILLASGYSIATISEVMGCDQKTLRKVFSRELSKKKIAALELRSGMMAKLATEGERGNVGAIKHLDRMLEAERLRTGSFADRPAAAPKEPAKGKKESRIDAALYAGAGDPEWSDLLDSSRSIGGLPN